jgi:hypothetical protein
MRCGVLAEVKRGRSVVAIACRISIVAQVGHVHERVRPCGRECARECAVGVVGTHAVSVGGR